MISYWWNLNSAFHVSPPRGQGKWGRWRKGMQFPHKQARQFTTERKRNERKETGERQRLREDRIEAEKEIRKTVS